MQPLSINISFQASDRGFGFNGQWVNSRTVVRNHTAIATKTSEEGNCNAVIMGATTAKSIPAKFLPLPGRLTIIVSTQWADLSKVPVDYLNKENLFFCPSFCDAVDLCSQKLNVENIFVIGGQRLLEEAIGDSRCQSINVAEMDFGKKLDCDVFFPEIPDHFELVSTLPAVTEEIMVDGEKCLTQIVFKTYKSKN